MCTLFLRKRHRRKKKTPTISINIDMVFQKCQTFTNQYKEYKTKKYKNKPKTSVI